MPLHALALGFSIVLKRPSFGINMIRSRKWGSFSIDSKMSKFLSLLTFFWFCERKDFLNNFYSKFSHPQFIKQNIMNDDMSQTKLFPDHSHCYLTIECKKFRILSTFSLNLEVKAILFMVHF